MRNERLERTARALAAYARTASARWRRAGAGGWIAAARRHPNLLLGIALAIGILLMVLHWGRSAPATVEEVRAERERHAEPVLERDVARHAARELAAPELRARVR